MAPVNIMKDFAAGAPALNGWNPGRAYNHAGQYGRVSRRFGVGRRSDVNHTLRRNIRTVTSSCIKNAAKRTDL